MLKNCKDFRILFVFGKNLIMNLQMNLEGTNDFCFKNVNFFYGFDSELLKFEKTNSEKDKRNILAEIVSF